MPIPMGKGIGGGIGGLIVLALLAILGGGALTGGESGGSLTDIFKLPGAQVTPGAATNAVDPEAEMVDFVSAVLDDIQATWTDVFERGGDSYPRAKLVLFEQGVSTGCGNASSAVGPFYCPPDQKVYLDLSFFDELSQRFGAPGDFASAYVIAHEIGHHIQRVTGVEEEVRKLQQKTPSSANDYSVRLELQADCLAGVWGWSANRRGIIEPGDLEEGIAAAAAVGDDRLQKQAGQRVNPEAFTHGTSEQRTRWFLRGFESGDPGDCDTFAASQL